MFLAHLAQPNWLLSCKFERHQSTTVKLRSDLVHYCVNASKKPFFSSFFVPKHKFFPLIVAFFI